ncbi:MAG: TonB-dependent receptor, partial [Alphaproteobacteria bacterium]|nr:TonB-dependent receptor [Alphaproteobacteria bacterium]
NIRTYSPLDHKGLHVSGDVGRGFVDLGDGTVENYAVRGSWANDSFGISGSFSRFQFEQETDNSEPRFDDIGITQLRLTKYQTLRRTESFSGKVQWQPADSLRLSASYLDTKFKDFELRNQFRFQYNRAFSGTRNFETADLVGVPMDGLFQDGIYENGVKLAVFNADYENDGWEVVGDVAYTKTIFDTTTPLVTMNTSTALGAPTVENAERFPSLQLDVNAVAGGIPFATLFDTVLVDGVPTRGARQDFIDQRQFTRELAGEFSSSLRTESWTGKLAVEREWSNLGADAKLSFGLQFDDRSQDSTVFNQLLADGTTRGTLDLASAADALGVTWTPFDFITRDAWDTGFPFGFNATYMDNRGLFQQFNAIQDAARAANEAGTGNFAVISPDQSLFNTVDERVIAGYLMNRWQWDRHTIVAGVRIENTEIETQGSALIGATQTPVSFSSEETRVFPSLHYNFEATDDIKLRAAFITGQARPSLNDMRATVTINDAAQTISGGNVEARPETAYGVDVSAEWYFAPGAILSISGYHREVDGVLFDASTTITDGRFDSEGVSRDGFIFSSVLNGGDGHLSGVELVYNHAWTFLPGALSGFGFTGSVALNTGSFRTPDGIKTDFPGTSDSIISGSLFYEKYGLSARVLYQTRSAWLDEVFPSGSTANANLFWARSTRVDASIRYQITDNFSVYADGTNLTDERGVRFQGSPDRPFEVEGFGRRFLFGVRANF